MELRNKSVTMLVFRALLANAERQGRDPDSLCRECGVQAHELAAERISGDRYLRAIQLTADLPSGIDVSADGIGGFLGAFPEFAGVVCNSPTLREALKGFLRYRDLIGNVDWLLAEDASDAVAFEFVLEGGQATALAAFGNFAMLASLARLYDPAVRIGDITLTGTLFGNAAHLRDVLRADACFGRPRNRLVLQSGVLDRPFERYNQTLAEIHLQYAAKMQDRLRARESFARSSQTMLGAWLREGFDDAPAAVLQQRLCDEYGISRWTLQRRLGAELTSFHEVLMRARMFEARALLQQTRLPIGEIAMRVGYASLSAFTRAFTRDCKSTPSRYRDLCAS